MTSVTRDGNNSDSLTLNRYWKHVRRPVLRLLAREANLIAPNHPDYCNDPQAATKDAYERLIFDLLHALQDEIGALIIVVKDDE
jgi:hypothetical protein